MSGPFRKAYAQRHGLRWEGLNTPPPNGNVELPEQKNNLHACHDNIVDILQ
jgi:hypothetical protein